MKGIQLNEINAKIRRVDKRVPNLFNFALHRVRETWKDKYIKEFYRDYLNPKKSRFNPKRHYPDIPYKVYAKHVSIQDLAILRFSSGIMMDDSIYKEFKNPSLRVIDKIRSSMWRWDTGETNTANWNTLVDAYRAIRSFKIDLPDFEVTLDHSTGYNERGYSEHSRTFLDGVFAYLIHYRGKHVMTVSFTILPGNKVLVNQIQLVQKKGNRFLYKMPCHYFDFILERINISFKKFQLYMVRGLSLADYYKTQYSKNYKDVVEDFREKLAMRHKGDLYKKRVVNCLDSIRERKAKLEEYETFTYSHIHSLYSRDLHDFKRVRGIEKMGLYFNKLSPLLKAA